MNQPNFERTQKRNPYQLTVNQHVHSAHCIKKFAGPDGKVGIRELPAGNEWRALPKAKVFCTKRAWDEVTEKSRMAHFEKRYFAVLADPGTYETRNHDAVSAYYVLWHFRFTAAAADREPLKLNMVAPERELDLDSRELLESKGYLIVNPDSTMSSRFVRGARFYLDHDREMERLRDVRWGLAKSVSGELLCPDNHGGTLYMPISPTMALIGNHKDGTLAADDVVRLNRHSKSIAVNWLIARTLCACPI